MFCLVPEGSGLLDEGGWNGLPDPKEAADDGLVGEGVGAVEGGGAGGEMLGIDPEGAVVLPDFGARSQLPYHKLFSSGAAPQAHNFPAAPGGIFGQLNPQLLMVNCSIEQNGFLGEPLQAGIWPYRYLNGLAGGPSCGINLGAPAATVDFAGGSGGDQDARSRPQVQIEVEAISPHHPPSRVQQNTVAHLCSFWIKGTLHL